MAKINVQHNVNVIADLDFVKDAWSRGVTINIHGLIYDLETGLLENLNVSRNS